MCGSWIILTRCGGEGRNLLSSPHKSACQVRSLWARTLIAGAFMRAVSTFPARDSGRSIQVWEKSHGRPISSKCHLVNERILTTAKLTVLSFRVRLLPPTGSFPLFFIFKILLILFCLLLLCCEEHEIS